MGFFAYQTNPHSTTNETPAELLMNRKLVTALSLTKPDIQNRNKQPMPVCPVYQCHFVYQEFKQGDNIWLQNDSGKGENWLPDNVIETTGPLSYIIGSNNGDTLAN